MFYDDICLKIVCLYAGTLAHAMFGRIAHALDASVKIVVSLCLVVVYDCGCWIVRIRSMSYLGRERGLLII